MEFEEGDGAFAFVVSGDATNQTVKMRPIKVTQIDGGEALIDEGLKAGEVVVVDGQYKLQDGSSVKAVEPTSSSATSPPKKFQHKTPDAKP